MMYRSKIVFFMLAAVMVCLASKTLALDQSEITALTDFYNAHQAVLGGLFPPWSADPSTQCNGAPSTFYGLTCTATTNGHISGLSLSNVVLGGTIPSSLSGLINATQIVLNNCGLTGTIPESIGEMPHLAGLDLRNNKLSLCSTTPFALIPPAANCLLSGQATTICANNTCCGCQADWAATFGCSTNIPVCSTCTTGSPPPEYPNATCSNGYYVIPSSYTGALTITGKAAVIGDLTIPSNQALTFVGFSSTLNVTGRFTMKANNIVIAATSADQSNLKYLGSLTYQRVYYMYVSNPSTTLGTFNGATSLVAVHPPRACNKPYNYGIGNAYTWAISVRYTSTCNTWWIILVCVLPTLGAGLIGGLLPVCLK